jgi:hypothetical protein
MLVEQADAAMTIAESNQAFSEQADPHRWAVGEGNLFAEQCRRPIPAEERPDQGPGPGLRQQLMLGASERREAESFVLQASQGYWPRTRAALAQVHKLGSPGSCGPNISSSGVQYFTGPFVRQRPAFRRGPHGLRRNTSSRVQAAVGGPRGLAAN